jgi:alkanesulfonate monooxygenase SsuD/methylene tetrahydromethanopterin reductase-like flavin-dependent oxidoreductase (luciferase family)
VAHRLSTRRLKPGENLKIFVAALSPAMLRLGGEIGDGVMLWLCNPTYIRDVVVPAVREGRELAGKPATGFEIVAAVPAALTDDPSTAHEAIRGELLTYFSLPFYRTMLERSGYGADIAAFDAAVGDPESRRAAVSDQFLEVLTAVGDEPAVRGGVDRVSPGRPHGAVHRADLRHGLRGHTVRRGAGARAVGDMAAPAGYGAAAAVAVPAPAGSGAAA